MRKHPVSGDETLFVNAAFAETINELAADESDAMLRHLYSRIYNPAISNAGEMAAGNGCDVG